MTHPAPAGLHVTRRRDDGSETTEPVLFMTDFDDGERIFLHTATATVLASSAPEVFYR